MSVVCGLTGKRKSDYTMAHLANFTNRALIAYSPSARRTSLREGAQHAVRVCNVIVIVLCTLYPEHVPTLDRVLLFILTQALFVQIALQYKGMYEDFLDYREMAGDAAHFLSRLVSVSVNKRGQEQPENGETANDNVEEKAEEKRKKPLPQPENGETENDNVEEKVKRKKPRQVRSLSFEHRL
jgi:hypothetical protein